MSPLHSSPFASSSSPLPPLPPDVAQKKKKRQREERDKQIRNEVESAIEKATLGDEKDISMQYLPSEAQNALDSVAFEGKSESSLMK